MKLPFERPAYLALGAMLAVLVSSPAKASCHHVRGLEALNCFYTERKLRDLEYRQGQLEQQQRNNDIFNTMPTFPSRRSLY